MALSDYFIGLITGWLKGVNFPTAPSTVYVALFVGDPALTGTDVTTQINPNGRVAVTFGVESGKAIANSAIVDFGNSANAVTGVSHFAIYDAQSGGNKLVSAALTDPKQTYAIGDPVNFDIDLISITLADNYSAYLRAKLFDWIKGTDMPTAPTNTYDALFNGDPLDTGLGGTETTTALDSVNGRLPITWGTVTAKTLPTSAIIDHGTADTDADATHLAIYDQQTGGNQLFQGENSGTTSYSTGEAVNIPAGQLVINFNS